MKHRGFGFLALLVIPILWTECLGAAASHSDPANGKKLYEAHCAACHGPTGKGDGYRLLNPAPADLGSSAIAAKSDPRVITTIHDGRPNTAMGAWKWVLSEQETKDVLAYVRALSR